MTKHFHGALNRMTLFTAILVVGVLYFWADFMAISVANIWLNGIIIGTTLFGIGLCFILMFGLLPEYKWLHGYTSGHRGLKLPPVLLRFEDSRESVRYITNTLIFLGLLGTFWGLILTVGGFAELIGNLNFSDETVLQSMQAGLSRPLAGMATAFTSSLLGLGGSLTVGFLGLQVQTAQNTIYHELEDYLASHTHVAAPDSDR